jgi:hypothetical protein
MRCEVNSGSLGQGPMADFYEHRNELLSSTKAGNFLSSLIFTKYPRIPCTTELGSKYFLIYNTLLQLKWFVSTPR